MPNQFGSDQPEKICTKKVTYRLKFVKAYPGSDPQAAALGLAKLSGSITEKYECLSGGQLQTFRALKSVHGKLEGPNWGGSEQRPPKVDLTCNPDDPTDGLLNTVLQVIHKRETQGSLKGFICNPVYGGRFSIYDLDFYGQCWYELDECNPTEIPENTEIAGIIHPPDTQREQCWYEGDAGVDSFNGMEVPYDSIIGYLPEDLCSVPDDYQSQCNLSEIFLDKLGEAQLNASIGDIISSALFTVATGGSFSIFDILGVIGKIENPRVRDAMNSVLRVYEEALAEYLDCLKSELAL